jgi:carboxyl-terminal processing protease
MHSADTGSTVIWEGISDSTAWVRISEFSEDISTFDSFYSILPNLQKFSNIIIDLIDNTGGGIAATDSIINCILPLHTPYIMETYRNYDDKTRTAATVPWDTIKTTRGQDPFLANKRYALLINGYSASASEILIAALKDGFSGAPHGDTAVIIGETSYGKGIGQVEITRSVYKRRDLLITFMRMKGISPRVGDYFRKGIKPDVLVSTPPGEIDHTTQITAALKILEPSAPKIRAGLYKRVGSPSRFRAEASIVATPENVPQ